MTDIQTVAPSKYREIAPGVWWITECMVSSHIAGRAHVHTAPYLIIGSDKVLLWDTAPSSMWGRVEVALDELLGDRPIDYVVPSHPELAHCGNVPRLLEKYPEAQVAGDIRDYPLYYPSYVDRLLPKAHGEELDLGSHQFVFVEALIKDLSSTQWGYEKSNRILFVADGFAYSHRPPLDGDDRPTHVEGECSLLASELGDPPRAEQIVWITRAALSWTEHIPMNAFRARFDELLGQYPPRMVAPAHGAVIDDVDEILWLIWDSLGSTYKGR